MEKAVVFIDGGYIATLTKHLHPASDGKPRKLDFEKLCRSIAEQRECELLRGYLYHCPPFQGPYPTDSEKNRKQQYDRFIHGLKRLKRFQVREGRLSKVYNEKGEATFVQKGVDVLLAIDMIKLVLKGATQRIILIACDSDFVPVVRAIKDEGAVVELYHHMDGANEFMASRYLSDEVDEEFSLTKKILDMSTME